MVGFVVTISLYVHSFMVRVRISAYIGCLYVVVVTRSFMVWYLIFLYVSDCGIM